MFRMFYEHLRPKLLTLLGCTEDPTCLFIGSKGKISLLKQLHRLFYLGSPIDRAGREYQKFWTKSNIAELHKKAHRDKEWTFPDCKASMTIGDWRITVGM